MNEYLDKNFTEHAKINTNSIFMEKTYLNTSVYKIIKTF